MGMDIEVIEKTYYTVHLTDNDITKVKKSVICPKFALKLI